MEEREVIMFEVNEYVTHISGGICQIKDVTPLNIPGADKSRKYYVLQPIRGNGSTVFVPTDNDSAMRKIVTEDEALKLIDEIPDIKEMAIDNEKLRETIYRDAIKSCDLRNLVSVLKNLYVRRNKRIEEGKKTTATDDKYFKIAEENLYSELAFVLGRDKKEMREFVFARIH